MKHEIIKRVEETRQKFSEIYGIKVKKLPIKFTLKGRVAGRVTYNQKYNFNLHIAENNEGFLERTIPHEVAHQVSVQINGLLRGKGHGIAWRRVMRSFGVEPSRCHSYKNVVAARKTTKYDYTCLCGEHYILSSIRYNKARRGKVVYSCPKCKEMIEMSKAIRRK